MIFAGACSCSPPTPTCRGQGRPWVLPRRKDLRRPLDRQARERVTAKQIAALGREYGLEVGEVAPAIARALTPGQAVSPRSAVPMLEGVLGPVFQACARQGEPLRLEGTLENMYLVPARENR